MNTERIEELEQLVAAATPGPWRMEMDDESDTPMILSEYGHVANIEEGLGSNGDEDQADATAAFIAAARTAVPELLAEVRRLSAAAPVWVSQVEKALHAAEQNMTDVVQMYATGNSQLVFGEAVRDMKNDALKLVKAARKAMEAATAPTSKGEQQGE